MEVLVKELFRAAEHDPAEGTYAVRIMNSDENKDWVEGLFKKNNDKYFYIARYTFDDSEPGVFFDGMFDENIAKNIIVDFEKNGLNKAKVLLVNCDKAESRSPAIALALNEIFELNGGITWEKYPCMNTFIYRTMKYVANRDLKPR